MYPCYSTLLAVVNIRQSEKAIIAMQDNWRKSQNCTRYSCWPRKRTLAIAILCDKQHDNYSERSSYPQTYRKEEKWRMDKSSNIIMPRARPLHFTGFQQGEHKDEALNDQEYELCVSFGSKLSVEAQEMHISDSLEPPETQSPTKHASFSPKKNRDRLIPLAECDNWLSFDELELLDMDDDLNQSSMDPIYHWGSPRSLNAHFMFGDTNDFNQRESSQNQNELFFSDSLLGNANEEENESSSLLSDNSRAHKPVVAIRKRIHGFTPLKFLTSRSGKHSVDSDLSQIKKESPEDGVELLGDWRESESSRHPAFDVDLFEADEFILEESEPPMWNFQADDVATRFGPSFTPPSTGLIIPDPEERDDSGMQNRFLYDDCNQRIPHPGRINNDDSSYGAAICSSFLDSFTCQPELFRLYRHFDKIEHRQRQRPNSARRRRKKISKKKKKKRLREQREGSHRASNFQCNLSTIVEHSDEDEDHESLNAVHVSFSGEKQSLSLQSSSTGNGSVNSDEDTPYSDGFYNPREFVLVAARRGDWEIQEMQEI